MDKMEIETDLTADDHEKIRLYKEEGMPGIGSVEPSKIQRMTDLYLTGHTYHEVSQKMRIKKDIVLFLADKHRWFSLKKEALQDLEKNFQTRAIEFKKTTPAFLLNLIQHLQQEMVQLMASDTGGIEPKLIGNYIKALETLNKIMPELPTNTPVAKKESSLEDDPYFLAMKDESLGASEIERMAEYERIQERAEKKLRERGKKNNYSDDYSRDVPDKK